VGIAIRGRPSVLWESARDEHAAHQFRDAKSGSKDQTLIQTIGSRKNRDPRVKGRGDISSHVGLVSVSLVIYNRVGEGDVGLLILERNVGFYVRKKGKVSRSVRLVPLFHT
jgi:hypothetical protein